MSIFMALSITLDEAASFECTAMELIPVEPNAPDPKTPVDEDARTPVTVVSGLFVDSRSRLPRVDRKPKVFTGDPGA